MLKMLSMGPRFRKDDVGYCNFESQFRDFCLSPIAVRRFKVVKTFIRDSNARKRGPILRMLSMGPRFREDDVRFRSLS
jgi:hypothetical protein